MAAGFANTAFADDHSGYVGVGGIMYDSDGVYGVEARGGFNLADYFGVEAQASFGVSKIEDNTFNTPVEVGISSSIAGFGVARLPVSDQFNIFGRIGYHSTEVSGDVAGLTPAIDLDLDGLAFGGGIEFFFDGRNGIRAEYTNLDAGDDGIDGSLDTVSLGYVVRF